MSLESRAIPMKVFDPFLSGKTKTLKFKSISHLFLSLSLKTEDRGSSSG